MSRRLLRSGWLWLWLTVAVAGTTIDLTALMDAIRAVESGGNAWAICDNSGNRSYYPADRTAAVTKATELLNAGHNIDMGLMQINSIHLRRPGISIANIFDAPSQASLASTIFSEFYTAARAIHGDTDQAVWHAVGAYNMGTRALRVYNVPYISKVAFKMGLDPAQVLGGAEAVPRQPSGTGVATASSLPPSTLPPAATEQLPGKWRTGQRVGLDDPSTQNPVDEELDWFTIGLVIVALILVVLALLLLLKLKLLWWAAKAALKAAARQAAKQMSKRRQTI